MESSFFGDFLILFLIFLNCSRIFFLKYGKIDSLTILAPICLLLSVIQIYSWNADIFSLLIFVISIFCFLINFRAFLRFIGGLYVDHYSAGFKSGALIIMLVCIFQTAFMFHFRPVYLNKKNYPVKETNILLTGDFTGGFRKAAALEPASAEVKVLEPQNKYEANGQTVIIVADKLADSIEYLPLMKILASKGYKVYTADFYARDVKWLRNAGDFKTFRKFLLKLSYFQNPAKFEMQKEFYAFNSRCELLALTDFVYSQEKITTDEGTEEFEPVFIVGDKMSDICIDDLKKEKNEKICGYFKLSECESYKSKGFGFVQQTNPFTAYLLNLAREPELTNLVLCAEEITKQIPEPVFDHSIKEASEEEKEESVMLLETVENDIE